VRYNLERREFLERIFFFERISLRDVLNYNTMCGIYNSESRKNLENLNKIQIYKNC